MNYLERLSASRRLETKARLMSIRRMDGRTLSRSVDDAIDAGNPGRAAAMELERAKRAHAALKAQYQARAKLQASISREERRLRRIVEGPRKQELQKNLAQARQDLQGLQRELEKLHSQRDNFLASAQAFGARKKGQYMLGEP